MPGLVCPNCRRINPEQATFCYFDGVMLRGQAGTAQDPHRLATEFYFPSGRCCRTFDELAAGCQDEWNEARELLQQGRFKDYFSSWGRHDLARAAQEAMAQPDPDIGLSNLLTSLPATSAQGPKLDINPRRLTVGRVLAGDQRKVLVKVANLGKGILQGTLKVSQGVSWLRLAGSKDPSSNGQLTIKTPREQEVTLLIRTEGLAAGQTYGAKLTVITNGGVVEVPVKLELAAQPFARAPFQGARAPREIAEKMRANPKGAVPLLESGEVAKWFAANGWNYPVSGTPARGVAGVQQFFEALGLSKPPVVQLSQPTVRLTCTLPDAPQGQVHLRTDARKWVYANITTDQPWINIPTPSVAGAQQAAIQFTIDPRQLPKGRTAEGSLQVVANGGQKLKLRVQVEIQRPVMSGLKRMLRPILTMAIALGLLRFLLIPMGDFFGRSAALQVASERVAQAAEIKLAEDAPARVPGAWLRLPWFGLLLGQNPPIPAGFFGDLAQQEPNLLEFRSWFISILVRTFVLWSWWLGSVLWLFVLLRNGGKWTDAVWGLLAGAVLGAVVAATCGCLLLVGDLLPHLIWTGLFGATGGIVFLPVWSLLAVICWVLLGVALGAILGLLGPLGRLVLLPLQETLAWMCRQCGLKPAAAFFTSTGE